MEPSTRGNFAETVIEAARAAVLRFRSDKLIEDHLHHDQPQVISDHVLMPASEALAMVAVTTHYMELIKKPLPELDLDRALAVHRMLRRGSPPRPTKKEISQARRENRLGRFSIPDVLANQYPSVERLILAEVDLIDHKRDKPGLRTVYWGFSEHFDVAEDEPFYNYDLAYQEAEIEGKKEPFYGFSRRY